MKAQELLKKLGACQDAIDWASDKTIQEAWDTCPRGDWMLWFYKRQYPGNTKELTLAKGHCANTVRHLMKDQRSIDAVDAAIAYGEGKISLSELEKAAHVAYVAYAADATYAADTAADTTAYAAYAAAYAADAVDAADAAAKTQNQQQTADICRKYLELQ